MWSMKDAETIQTLGGPTAVAKLLGFETPGGARRVHNWLKRGIPTSIKVQFAEIFLNIAATNPQPATPAPAGSDIETAAAGQGA